jgi:capsular exopolysaccharide synthesis family protein
LAQREPQRGAGTGGADWLQPPAQERGLASYVQTLRERFWLIVLAVAITTGAAILYVATASKTYQSEADILVTPVPPQSGLLTSLGLISQSADPVREIETVARYIDTNEVAARAQKGLSGVPEAEGSTQDLLSHISAEPVADSNIVAVTASASTADNAAKMANVFVASAIDYRTAQLHDRVATAIHGLNAQVRQHPPDTHSLEAQLSELKRLESGPDPTLQPATRAVPPTSQSSPKPALSIAGGLLVGLVLGIGGAFAYQALDPRLSREEQLRARFRLPILARIPRESRAQRNAPISPENLSPGALEAYRALRASLGPGRAGDGRARAVLITSPSASEGKTTTAVNLATSLTLAGRKVILMDGDLRKPEIGPSLGVNSSKGLVSVLLGEASLDEALVSSSELGSDLKLLLAEQTAPWTSEIFSLPTTQPLVDEARSRADFVIIDSSPLSEVIDALPLAAAVDHVLVVVRLGKTRIGQLTELGELMVENDIRPAGFAVVGAPRPSRADYHKYAGRPRIVRSDDGATAESKQPPPKPKQAPPKPSPPKQAPPKPKPSPSGSKPAPSAGARSGSSQ